MRTTISAAAVPKASAPIKTNPINRLRIILLSPLLHTPLYPLLSKTFQRAPAGCMGRKGWPNRSPFLQAGGGPSCAADSAVYTEERVHSGAQGESATGFECLGPPLPSTAGSGPDRVADCGLPAPGDWRGAVCANTFEPVRDRRRL